MPRNNSGADTVVCMVLTVLCSDRTQENKVCVLVFNALYRRTWAMKGGQFYWWRKPQTFGRYIQLGKSLFCKLHVQTVLEHQLRGDRLAINSVVFKPAP